MDVARYLDHPWITRAGTIAFLAGVVSWVVGLVGSWSVLTIIGIVVTVVGALIVAPLWIRPDIRSRFFPPREELRVAIEHIEWTNWRHAAHIAEMRIRIQNRSNKRKQLSGLQLLIKSAGNFPEGFETELDREVESRRQRHSRLDQVSILEPHARITGWMVYWFPWRTEPGEPDFTLTVKDELGYDYEARKAYKSPTHSLVAKPMIS